MTALPDKVRGAYNHMRFTGEKLTDVDTVRFDFMREQKVDVQVLSYTNPVPDTVPSEEAVKICREANDILADMVKKHPDRFAAAMALCGGSTLKELCGLNRMPLWILHGTADRAVGIGASQRVVDAMETCDTAERLIWTPLQGANHGRLARIFYLPKTYEWLFSHSLADRDRTVNHDYDITVEELADKNIYRAARSGGNKVVTEKAVGSSDNTEYSENSGDSESSGTRYHTVKKGDTLSKLARRYHTTVKKLCKLNGIKQTSKLQIGKKIRIK